MVARRVSPGRYKGSQWRNAHRHGLSHHFRILNAAPQVAAVRHVAALALYAFLGVRACLPFVKGVLQQFVVEGEGSLGELVARLAEFRPLERRRGCETAVGQNELGGRRGKFRAARRPEALVLSNVAARADQPGLLKLGVERLVRAILGALLYVGNLLAERSVAGGADRVGRRVVGLHVEELAIDPGSHAAAVQAGRPVVELLAVAEGTFLGVQRRLNGRKGRRRLALRRHGQAPVSFHEGVYVARLRLHGLLRLPQQRGEQRDDHQPGLPAKPPHHAGS